jgi:hypothetical protein
MPAFLEECPEQFRDPVYQVWVRSARTRRKHFEKIVVALASNAKNGRAANMPAAAGR